MISAPYTFIFAVLLSINTSFQSGQIDPFDYSSYPYHPFDIQHAQLNLDLEADQHLVNGSVIYTVSSKVDGLIEIQLHAGDLSLDEVLIDEEEVEYRVNSDSLIIQLSDTLSRGEDFELSIKWQTTSGFGLHRDHNGSFWSSTNPKAHRHWLPGFDHPREEFTFNAEIRIPNNMEVLFNGNLGEVSIASQTKKRVEWNSETPVPATGLGFVMGRFQISEMTAGFTKLRLFHDSSVNDQAADLVVEAARLKREIEDDLSFEFPWNALNIVVLPDNFWMERTHGSGTIYLFERLGDLKTQLARNMFLQWFGEHQRTEQYFQTTELIPTSLYYKIFDEAGLISNPDSVWKINEWNNWQLGYQNESLVLRTTVEASLEELMREFSGVVEADGYTGVWYEKTGIPFFGIKPRMNIKEESATGEYSRYAIDIELDEINSELTLLFELEDGSGEELYEIRLIEHQFDVVTNQSISYTGNRDTVIVSIPAATEFVTFESPELAIQDFQLRDAPLFYLLNQLRSQEPQNRISAAKLLVNHSDNPDLQLALSDILAFEEDPEVIAAIYEALAKLTSGASGTEEQFISGLSNNSEAIQLASIRALTNYPDNEYVRSSLLSKAVRSQDKVFEQALYAYNLVASGEEMLSLVQSVQRRDTVGLKTLKVFEIADSLHQNEDALQMVEDYLSQGFPYSIRNRALNYLDQFDLDSDRWNIRLNELANDRDPRIRFWAAEHATRFKSSSEALVFLNTVETDEMDPRVLLMIETVKEGLRE